MSNQRLAFFLSICLAATLAGTAHADVPGIKDGAQLTREIAAKVSNIDRKSTRLNSSHT